MSKPDRHALAIIDDPKFAVEKPELPKLQEAAIAQLRAVHHMEASAAKCAVLSGLTLLRVRASMKGKFLKWMGSICTTGANATPIKQRQAYYYMSLAKIVLAKHRLQLPALLALPGDQQALDLGDNHASRSVLAAVNRFVGHLSLNELLEKHDIKAKKDLGGAREAGESEEATVLDPEEMEQQATDEIGTALLHLESLLEEGTLQHIRDRNTLRGVEESVTKIARTVSATVKAHGKDHS